MDIIEVKNNKREYIDLLLLADEQEDMVEKYLDRGTMYALKEDMVKAVCVVTDEGNSVLEIKNIAVKREYQKMGYGKKLIEFIERKYKGSYNVLKVGTGDSRLTIPFYEKCGFVRAYRVKNFFTDNYDHPIFELGKQLVDMVYLEKSL